MHGGSVPHARNCETASLRFYETYYCRTVAGLRSPEEILQIPPGGERFCSWMRTNRSPRYLFKSRDITVKFRKYSRFDLELRNDDTIYIIRGKRTENEKIQFYR